MRKQTEKKGVEKKQMREMCSSRLRPYLECYIFRSLDVSWGKAFWVRKLAFILPSLSRNP